jgi:hypothetical protein
MHCFFEANTSSHNLAITHYRAGLNVKIVRALRQYVAAAISSGKLQLGETRVDIACLVRIAYPHLDPDRNVTFAQLSFL